jgi:hypothetical protein
VPAHSGGDACLWLHRRGASYGANAVQAQTTLTCRLSEAGVGVNVGSYENFASLCRQDYPGYQIPFAVKDETAPAVPSYGV